MAEQEGAQPQDQQLSAETLALAELGRNGAQPPARDPMVKDDSVAIPEGVPEQFVKDGKVDVAGLAKSYAELRKKMDAKPAEGGDPEPKEDEKDADKGVKIADQKEPEGEAEKGDEDGNEPSKELASVFDEAAQDYAKNGGELSTEAREKLVKAGIPEATIDLYLEGVKAQEKALEAAVFAAAGGEDAYRSAVSWAASNWTDDQIAAFDSALSGPTRDTVVKGLMAAFREAGAPPTEGNLVDVKSGSTPGDVYQDKNEFVADLAKVNQIADRTEQQVARKKAIQKLERSKKAGTIKEVTPRRPSF